MVLASQELLILPLLTVDCTAQWTTFTKATLLASNHLL